MTISKTQLISGITSYVRTQVVPNVTDNNFKFIITAAIAAMEVNPGITDIFFGNQIISYLADTNGDYNVDQLEKILSKALSECGKYVLTIPAIKFVMPHEQELSFTAKDITSLFEHIRSVK